MGQFSYYMVGFHPMKAEPQVAVEAHHYCTQVNSEFAHCTIFDGNSTNANLVGIEYIVSERIFDSFGEGEREYWHPHNYEILSGMLVMPGLPAPMEKEMLAGKMNSYGKTWHTWQSGSLLAPGVPLPLEEAMLAWSYNADGEIAPAMLAERDRRMGIDTAKERADRADLVDLAHPQWGVDALAPSFPNRIPMRGVEDKGAVSEE